MEFFHVIGFAVAVIAACWAWSYVHDLYVQSRTVKFNHPYLGEVSLYKNQARSWVVADDYALAFQYHFPMLGSNVEEIYVDFMQSFMKNYPSLKTELGKCAIFEFNKEFVGKKPSKFKEERVYFEKLSRLNDHPELFLGEFELQEISALADGAEYQLLFMCRRELYDGIFIRLNRNLEIISSGIHMVP
jgi:hypothetical protein